ncbi:MAG TPA: NAD(P)/FAD-dependent oxidoreductase [Nocardioidaceae bacterium]|nr:NAD(P)/FAD-dependent oxidoreductase [Nocardioidaceae bacterium]
MTAPSIAIIGSGFAGLDAAVQLKKAGYTDITILEKADEVGGVWRENTYPGAACDVPSPFYSYSYERNPRWPRRFSQQPAILEYLKGVADKYDVRRHIRFHTEVTAAAYDETSRKWTVEVMDGEPLVVDVLVSAVGQLSRPSWPNIKGRDTFAGPSFHSAEWDHSVELEGKRVAVIGTGASAIQFVPEIQPEVARLELFQRTPPYIIPRPDTQYRDVHHKVFERLPFTQLAERATWYGVTESLSIAFIYSKPLAKVVHTLSRLHMKRQTKARPGLFEKVWPDYPVGCKRILFSSDYLPALAEPNVDVVTDDIQEITAEGVLTKDGVLHETDVIIYGTGFTATQFLAPMSLKGLGGVDLHDQWSEGARAYFGMTVPNFPNLFILYGPNTNTGGGSIIYFLEAQNRYLRDFVDHMVASEGPLMVRSEVEDAFDEKTQGKLSSSVWTACSSWYREANGRVTTNWPALQREYARQAQFDPADFEVV